MFCLKPPTRLGLPYANLSPTPLTGITHRLWKETTMLSKYIEELLIFACHHKMMDKLDIPQVRNQLFTLLHVAEPYEGALDYSAEATPVRLLNAMIDEAISQGLIDDSMTEKDILDAKIMAQLMPRQSELNRLYEDVKAKEGAEAATDYYYHLSQMSNYIRTDRIAKNKYWQTETDYGNLEITINLSKPEKDPKDIEKAKSMPQSNYPKCFLCIENVGYEGRVNHPARANHRVLPLTLNKEDWYIQYSPYVYYNEHAIVFKAAHEPMKIAKESFVRLTDFIEAMPHYFIGSNADLPIVGGSILSHDHFQGGHHRFAMVDAKTLGSYTNSDYPEVAVKMIEWPLSVVRLSSSNKEQLVDFAYDIFSQWKKYSDESVGIYAYSRDDGEDIPHNTVTPIARMNDAGAYEIDLALRNNRRSEAHPDGIFHPHEHLHHIKKENIGLIEVMGLAVLPARLDDDMGTLAKVLTGESSVVEVNEVLPHHGPWLEGIVAEVGTSLDEVKALEVIQKAIGKRFAEVLECAGVYKMNDQGVAAFDKFIQSLGCNKA